MNPFEKALLNDIPEDYAADFFLRVTGRDKLAEVEAAGALRARAETLVKRANMMAMPGPGMAGGVGPKPPAAVPTPAAPPLAPTGMGQNNVKMGSLKAAMRKAAAEMKISFDGSGGLPPPGAPEGEPTIEQYMAEEMAGQQAEEQQGAEYFKQRFQQASQQLQETQAQASETQAQAEQLQQQVAEADQQVQSAMQQAQMASQSAMQNVQSAHEMAMQATSQAMESQAEVLKQKQLAAAMRMGVQQLKDNVMGAMANDPTEQLAQQLQAPPPGSAGVVGQNPQQPQPAIDPATGQPMPQDPAMAGQDPNAAAPAPQGGAPEQGAAPAKPASEKKESKPKEEKSEKKDEKKSGGTEVTVKHSAARFMALAQKFRKAV